MCGAPLVGKGGITQMGVDFCGISCRDRSSVQAQARAQRLRMFGGGGFRAATQARAHARGDTALFCCCFVVFNVWFIHRVRALGVYFQMLDLNHTAHCTDRYRGHCRRTTAGRAASGTGTATSSALRGSRKANAVIKQTNKGQPRRLDTHAAWRHAAIGATAVCFSLWTLEEVEGI